MSFHLKIHDTEDGKVVAACDKDILGEAYQEGDTKLALEEDFYGKEEGGFLELLEALKECVTANIAGEELVSELLDEGLVKEKEVKTVEGVPHVQLFFVR
ncbi:MAG: DUF424 family protein [Candidatus Nanohaloarchaeota archaeon QJJ-9]|nr:DUF424 family protein [Candidatus Nanohaloarchaeota archaeon QJJ-9]